MGEDTKDDLESESRVLIKFYEKLLGETKTFKSQMETLEKDSSKKLAERDAAYGKNVLDVAAKWHTFDGTGGMKEELTKLQKHKDKFDKKKKAFQKDLDHAEWELSNRPRLLDDYEEQFKLCKTAATNLQAKVNELLPLWRQLSEEANKLNARIKKFNDSITTISEIPTVSISSPDLEGFPARLKDIMKDLESKEADIKDSRKELKGSLKQLEDEIAKLNAFQAAPAKPVKK